jgi:hypothetical protein
VISAELLSLTGTTNIVTLMDREAIGTAVAEWLDWVVQHDSQFEWLRGAELDVQPAFLVDHKTKEGDDYKAGAVRVAVTGDDVATVERSRQLHDLVIRDRTLGNRAKDARFEYSGDAGVAGCLVVIPS